jgi:hypothetical protein
MSEMIERVARAIDEASDEFSIAFTPHPGGPIDPLVERCRAADREKRMRQARAAIEAMREPTKDMEAAVEADAVIQSGLDDCNKHDIPNEAWRLMIDAALGVAR